MSYASLPPNNEGDFILVYSGKLLHIVLYFTLLLILSNLAQQIRHAVPFCKIFM